ncbi:hypothetical protein OTB20_40375 [Streptomyces sp. H27-H1]|uniref:hypothetical protein n=1 Tax=Streptomyces sp. H27-H1 TaxID=2996461 RepID=UPI0022722103|nr:hypothetical protein [Streptomyces sp. H27-H1]MCY0932303.1 hypothetical protein [Streptomyces sp. H27-H1]
MNQAATAFTTARTEAEQHGNNGEQAISQTHLALAYAFTDPGRANDDIALAEQLVAGLDQRATALTPRRRSKQVAAARTRPADPHQRTTVTWRLGGFRRGATRLHPAA